MVEKKGTPKNQTLVAKTLVSWGEKAKLLARQFKCLPQPKISSQIELVLLEDKRDLVQAGLFCKQELAYQTLLLINCIEYKEVFQLIYQLQKFKPEYELLCLAVNLNKENPQISSLNTLFRSADWFERELWDLQGIFFEGHPNLKRILNPEDWEGFSLRKNYIPPVDALNGSIAGLKKVGKIKRSNRKEIEKIEPTDQKLV